MTVALSSTEAEYGSLAEGAREVVFIRQLLADMKMEQSCSRIYEDNHVNSLQYQYYVIKIMTDP